MHTLLAAPRPAPARLRPAPPGPTELAGDGLALSCGGSAPAPVPAGSGPAPGAAPWLAPLPLPEGGVGELLWRAVQAGLPLRVRASAAGRALERQGAFDSLRLDGLQLVARAGTDRLRLHEARCTPAWCLRPVWRSGLRHRIELLDAGCRLRLVLEDATPADRPESCAWRSFVLSLLPPAGAPC